MRMIFRCDPALSEHLPRPVPARSALPDWLRAMPAKAHSDIHGRDIRTVKQCPPFVDAMAYGVLILLPCDVIVERGAFSWEWDIPEPATSGHPRAPLSFHVPAQFARSAVRARRPGRDQIQQFLDHRARARLVAVRHPSGQPRRPAVSPDLGAGGCRSLSTTAASISRRSGRSRIFPACCRRARRWRNALRCRAPRPNWCSKRFDEAHQDGLCEDGCRSAGHARRLSQAFSRAATGAFNRLSERRSAASSSHSRPCGAEVSAIAMVPKLGRAQPIGLRVGAHRAVEIAAFLQHDAEIERGFGMVRLLSPAPCDRRSRRRS